MLNEKTERSKIISPLKLTPAVILLLCRCGDGGEK